MVRAQRRAPPSCPTSFPTAAGIAGGGSSVCVPAACRHIVPRVQVELMISLGYPGIVQSELLSLYWCAKHFFVTKRQQYLVMLGCTTFPYEKCQLAQSSATWHISMARMKPCLIKCRRCFKSYPSEQADRVLQGRKKRLRIKYWGKVAECSWHTHSSSIPMVRNRALFSLFTEAFRRKKDNFLAFEFLCLLFINSASYKSLSALALWTSTQKSHIFLATPGMKSRFPWDVVFYGRHSNKSFCKTSMLIGLTNTLFKGEWRLSRKKKANNHKATKVIKLIK